MLDLCRPSRCCKKLSGGVHPAVGAQALLHSSHLYHEAKHDLGNYGISVENVQMDLSKMMAQKDKAVKGLTAGIEGLFKKNKVSGIESSSLPSRHAMAARHTWLLSTMRPTCPVPAGPLVLDRHASWVRAPVIAFDYIHMALTASRFQYIIAAAGCLVERFWDARHLLIGRQEDARNCSCW